MKNYPIAGIDYGSKMAGTTVLSYTQDGQRVQFLACRKGEDADAFLFRHLLELRPQRVFIDAPLSLPGVYKGLSGCQDYFYRKADRELRAMSPMFLGGLTARAIKLKDLLCAEEIHMQEAYPAALAYQLGLVDAGYKKEKGVILPFIEQLSEKHHLKIELQSDVSWHLFDAFLALLIALRAENQLVGVFGDTREGLIYV